MTDKNYADQILQLAVDNEVLSAEQADELEYEHEQTGKPVRDMLIDMEFLTEDQLLEIIAGYLGTHVINLPATDVSQRVIKSLPASVARMYNVAPVAEDGNTMQLAVSDMVDPQVMDELMFVLTRNVSFVLARQEDVRSCINQFYGDESDAVTDMLSAFEDEIDSVSESVSLAGESDERAMEEAAGATPVIRFCNLVLYQAIKDRASDIHFEPFEREFKIRYRVDGALYEMAPPPKRLAGPLISRIKVMSNLNIAERRVPQDGRIQLQVAGRPVDLRVSTLPTQFGESVVLRVLDRSMVSLEIDNIGMPDDVKSAFVTDISRPNGIVVVTGPTGSGKTTTLYAALNRINRIENKILTAEQPVEYDIDGIVQVQIDPSAGVTFANVLRAFLRQDPDAMMVGEIRDLETAQIAVQASLTGHLVFSTLHTNDAAGAITRLIDMGVAPYLISSTLAAVLGQRLVRRICEHCRQEFVPNPEILESLDLTPDDVGDRPFARGEGCQFCSDKGYHGRKGIFEMLQVTPAIQDMINTRQPTLIIRNKAIEQGMRTLREDGIRNILDHYTTVEEVVKYT